MRCCRPFLLSLPFTLLTGLSLPVSADFNSLLGCASRIIYNYKGCVNEIQALASFVQMAAIGRDYNESGQAYSAQCQVLEKQLKSKPAANGTAYKVMLANIGLTEGIRNLFMGFASPTYSCHSIGGYGGVQLFVGIVGVFDLAKCKSTLGNTWLEMRPGFELGYAFGGDLGVGGSLGWDRDVGYTPWPISLTPRASLDIGSIIGLRLSARGRLLPNTVSTGISAGGKIGGAAGMQMNLTLLPLGTDYEYLKTRLGDMDDK